MKKALIIRDSNNIALCKANSLSRAMNMLACFDSKASCKMRNHLNTDPNNYLSQFIVIMAERNCKPELPISTLSF